MQNGLLWKPHWLFLCHWQFAWATLSNASALCRYVRLLANNGTKNNSNMTAEGLQLNTDILSSARVCLWRNITWNLWAQTVCLMCTIKYQTAHAARRVVLGHVYKQPRRDFLITDVLPGWLEHTCIWIEQAAEIRCSICYSQQIAIRWW